MAKLIVTGCDGINVRNICLAYFYVNSINEFASNVYPNFGLELTLFIVFKFYYDTNVLKVDTSVFGFGFIRGSSYLVLFYYLVW